MGPSTIGAPTGFSRRAVRLVGALAILFLGAVTVRAADHGDTSLMFQYMRGDANISDLWAFVRNDHLVLAMGIHPLLPAGVTAFTFPRDVTYRFFIDRDSTVIFKECDKLAAFGGCIDEPDRIHEDIVFEITFGVNNRLQLRTKGFSADSWRELKDRIKVFSGTRSEAFIFAPFVKLNIAAIALEVPLDAIRKDQDTLLKWAAMDVETPSGTFRDHAGRALRSMFSQDLNGLHPKLHQQQLGTPPDVLILNTGVPSKFPNGRALADDVVDILTEAGEGQALSIELSRSENSATVKDVRRFLNKFPYLAPPQ